MDIFEHLCSAATQVKKMQAELEAHKELTPTTVDVSPSIMLVTAGAGGCQVKGAPRGDTFLRDGDMYALHRIMEVQESGENLVALRTSLSECIRQRDEVRTQVTRLHEAWDQKDAVIENLQEFNDKQRQQLESLQKEMAAIHMCVVATSQTKLDEVIDIHGREMPFLLKAVYEAMDRYFDTRAAEQRYASIIRAARHELES